MSLGVFLPNGTENRGTITFTPQVLNAGDSIAITLILKKQRQPFSNREYFFATDVVSDFALILNRRDVNITTDLANWCTATYQNLENGLFYNSILDVVGVKAEVIFTLTETKTIIALFDSLGDGPVHAIVSEFRVNTTVWNMQNLDINTGIILSDSGELEAAILFYQKSVVVDEYLKIVQDNESTYDNNTVTLFPLHSPITYIVECTYDSIETENIYVTIIKNGEVSDSFKPIKISHDIQSQKLTFLFAADGILRSLFKGFEDVVPTLKNPDFYYTLLMEDISDTVEIIFTNKDGTYNEKLIHSFIHATAQLGDILGRGAIQINDHKDYIAPRDWYAYVYFYNNTEGVEIKIDDIAAATTERGQYRGLIKTNFTEDIKDIWLKKNDTLNSKKTLHLVDFCESSDLLIKYLDHNGEYRFWVFNKYHEVVNEVSNIGSVNQFITNITDSAGRTKQLGNQSTIIINASTTVDEKWRNIFNDLYVSPRVSIWKHNENISTEKEKKGRWLDVVVESNGILKYRKLNNTQEQVSFILSEQNTIKM